MEFVFYVFNKILFSVLTKSKTIYKAFACLNFFHETINSYNLETATILLTSFSCFLALWKHTCRPIKTYVLSKLFYDMKCNSKVVAKRFFIDSIADQMVLCFGEYFVMLIVPVNTGDINWFYWDNFAIFHGSQNAIQTKAGVVAQPPIYHLSGEKLSRVGIFLMDTGHVSQTSLLHLHILYYHCLMINSIVL
mgnify:CR=1 FL=1